MKLHYIKLTPIERNVVLGLLRENVRILHNAGIDPDRQRMIARFYMYAKQLNPKYTKILRKEYYEIFFVNQELRWFIREVNETRNRDIKTGFLCKEVTDILIKLSESGYKEPSAEDMEAKTAGKC